jgi:hypothetical protein
MTSKANGNGESLPLFKSELKNTNTFMTGLKNNDLVVTPQSESKEAEHHPHKYYSFPVRDKKKTLAEQIAQRKLSSPISPVKKDFIPFPSIVSEGETEEIGSENAKSSHHTYYHASEHEITLKPERIKVTD